MKELFELIEKKIVDSGYPGKIDGEEFYNDISDEADEQENGDYMFIIKKSDLLSYEGSMSIMDQQFDLHYVDIIFGNGRWHVDFDA